MTATITMDEGGQITLPAAIKRAFGVGPGTRLRAEVSGGRLQIMKEDEPPEIKEGVLENGLLVLPHFGFTVDVGAALRAERDERSAQRDEQQ
ncbi:AbrB/MazE/SpoVT family DNA-binding domain-containing protein [Prosthecobacter sp.]|uniref:AbrB/MazE/SpoVT family DNA-binding domain-containing protein n=1 Tax=Prosthecobacter sp. TaxID=1965333 RepID=UPI00378449D7